MKKRLSLLLALLLVLAVAAGCSTQSAAPAATPSAPSDAGTEPAAAGFTSDEKFVIGVVLSKTGADAANGNYCIGGVEMAVEEINAAGGINGKEVVIAFGDDQGTAETAVNAFNMIFAKNPDMKALVAPVLSGLVLAMEDDITAAGIPALFGATNVALTNKGNELMFRVRPSDAVSATASAKFALEELKAERIGLIYCNNSFGTGGFEILNAYLESQGVTPVSIQDHGDDDKEYTAQLLAMQSANVDTILTWDVATPSGFISKQIMQLGLQANVVGSPAWTIDDVIKVAGEAHNGTYAINDGIPWNDAHPDADIAAKAVAYKARTGGYNNFGAAYYDAVYLLKQAAEAAVADGKTDDSATLVEYLHQIKDYVGVANTFTFDEAGEGVHSATIVQVIDGVPTFKKTVNVG